MGGAVPDISPACSWHISLWILRVVRDEPGGLAAERMMIVENREGKSSASPSVAVGLSVLLEGFGQAYNRQPVKAVAFFIAGVTLSMASGLNTWIARNVLGLKKTRVGPDRVQPGLLALWLATFVLNLADAWRTARRANK